MASPRMTIIRNLVNALRLASRPGGPSMVERLTALPRLARAVARGIPTFVRSLGDYASRADWDRALADEIAAHLKSVQG